MIGTRLGFVHKFVPGSSSATLLLLHGTGGDENDLLSLGRALAPDTNLLSPRGKVLEHGMPRFFRRDAMGVFDVEDLVARAHEVADFVEQAADVYALDPSRIIALGYSNGANVGAAVLLLRPSVLAGAALLHAMVPLELDELPDLTSVPVLVTGGRRDRMIPFAESERLAANLERAGADVTLEWSPGGHELTPAELTAVRDWLAPLSGG